MCEYSDIVKIDKVSRQNHSSGKIQMSEKSRNETPIYVNDDISNVVDNGMSKWLLPKKTSKNHATDHRPLTTDHRPPNNLHRPPTTDQ